jgi:hypothetical protein
MLFFQIIIDVYTNNSIECTKSKKLTKPPVIYNYIFLGPTQNLKRPKTILIPRSFIIYIHHLLAPCKGFFESTTATHKPNTQIIFHRSMNT